MGTVFFTKFFSSICTKTTNTSCRSKLILTLRLYSWCLTVVNCIRIINMLGRKWRALSLCLYTTSWRRMGERNCISKYSCPTLFLRGQYSRFKVMFSNIGLRSPLWQRYQATIASFLILFKSSLTNQRNYLFLIVTKASNKVSINESTYAQLWHFRWRQIFRFLILWI